MNFIVIGISDDEQPFFTPQVLGIIRYGRLFSGGRRHHDIVRSLLPAGALWIDITVPIDNVFEQYRARLSPPTSHLSPLTSHLSPPTSHLSPPTSHLSPPTSATIIVFASGDPLFFGFANTIRRKMPEATVTVFPSFNSLQLLAHRLVMRYDDMRTVSLTGRSWHEFDRAVIERSRKIGVLTDREHSPSAIARRLLDYGYGYYRMYVGTRLGNAARERVREFSLYEAADDIFEQPNCVLLCYDEALDGEGRINRTFGIPDAAFALLDGRTRMITKMPIRLLTLQALDLPRRRVLWDIGFCTGSISVEARLQFPHLDVTAFEVRRECEEIIAENARRHGAPGIYVMMCDFCEMYDDDINALTAPDAVFIGGHGGRLKEMMAKVVPLLPTGGVIVMNSVTVQSRQLFVEACSEQRLTMSAPVHVSIDDYHPIDILKATKN